MQNYVERAVVMARATTYTRLAAHRRHDRPHAARDRVALDFNSLAEELVHLGINEPARGPTTSIVALLIPSNAK